VDAIAGDRTLASWRWTEAVAPSDNLVRVPAELRSASGQVDLVFRIGNPMRPKDAGVNSQDNRALGLLLCALKVKINN
jgi:hypothetical protein